MTSFVRCPHCGALMREAKLPGHLETRCPKLRAAEHVRSPRAAPSASGSTSLSGQPPPRAAVSRRKRQVTQRSNGRAALECSDCGVTLAQRSAPEGSLLLCEKCKARRDSYTRPTGNAVAEAVESHRRLQEQQVDPTPDSGDTLRRCCVDCGIEVVLPAGSRAPRVRCERCSKRRKTRKHRKHRKRSSLPRVRFVSGGSPGLGRRR